MDIYGLSTAAATVAPPRATTHGPAAGALLDGAEYDTETEDAAGASEAVAAAAARVRPPRPSNWESMSKNQKKSGSNMEGGHVECKVMVGPSSAWGPTLL